MTIPQILKAIGAGPSTRVTIRTRPARRQPQAGDIKTVRGTVMIRQQQYSRFDRAWVVTPRGKPRWEWVEKDSPNDQNSPNYSIR